MINHSRRLPSQNALNLNGRMAVSISDVPLKASAAPDQGRGFFWRHKGSISHKHRNVFRASTELY